MTGNRTSGLPALSFSEPWLQRLGEPERAELRALSAESDPELYFEGLYSFAFRQEQAGREDTAAEIYAAIQSNASQSTYQNQASRRLDALQGRGSNGARAEVLLRQLTRQSSDPTLLGAMFAAGTVFRLTRFATLSRLAASPSGSFWTRGFAARASASLAGFALEAPTFTLTQRLAGQALGREQDWSSTALRRDLASSFLVLGGLKLSAWAGASLYRRTGAVSGLSQTLFHQGATLGGIYLGHGLEQWTGLRPHRDGATTLVDSLAMLMQFHVAGRLSSSMLGENIGAWERALDLRTEVLAEQVRRPSPVTVAALATAGAGENSLGPHVLMMTSNGFDPKIFGTTNASLRAPQEARPEPTPEALESLLSPRVPRTRMSDAMGGGMRPWHYELVMRPLEDFLQAGASHVMATRDGREIRLRLTAQGFSKKTDDYMPPGIPNYQFEIVEGEARGELTLFLESHTLHLFSIRTQENPESVPDLPPGAGVIVMDWLASQAALRRQSFSVLGINNPRIFRILRTHSLLSPMNAMLQAARFQKPHGSRIVAMAPLNDASFVARHVGKGFFNVHGTPNPELLPPELSSFSVTREFQGDRSDRNPLDRPRSYDLNVSPMGRFLEPGFEAVIGSHEGSDLLLRIQSVTRQARDGEFSKAGTVVLEGMLSENGQNGKIILYLTPESFELFSIVTSHLPKGAGTMAIDWLATQAAIHRRNFGVLFIENSQILRILSRSRLMTPETPILECFRCSSGFDGRAVGTLGEYPQVPFNPWSDFYVVRGRPNPLLLPENSVNPSEN